MPAFEHHIGSEAHETIFRQTTSARVGWARAWPSEMVSIFSRALPPKKLAHPLEKKKGARSDAVHGRFAAVEPSRGAADDSRSGIGLWLPQILLH